MSHITHVKESCHTRSIQECCNYTATTLQLHCNYTATGLTQSIQECFKYGARVSHMNESRQINGWVVSHIWLSRVTHMIETCHTQCTQEGFEYGTRVTHMNESCHTYEWVMSHIWMSHVTHMNESCHTSTWLVSHLRRSHVTHVTESCRTWRPQECFKCGTRRPVGVGMSVSCADQLAKYQVLQCSCSGVAV